MPTQVLPPPPPIDPLSFELHIYPFAKPYYLLTKIYYSF